jgi:hypothetical protein
MLAALARSTAKAHFQAENDGGGALENQNEKWN